VRRHGRRREGGGGQGEGEGQRGGGTRCREGGAGRGGAAAAAGGHPPPVDRPQVRGHVVLPVELLVADSARVGLALQVGGHVVAVEVAGVRVGVVAHLAPVRVSILDAEAPYGDGRGGVGGAGQEALRGRLGVQTRQLALDLLLHLVAHEIGRGAGRGGRLRVDGAPVSRVQPFQWRFWVVREDGVVPSIPVGFGLALVLCLGLVGSVAAIEVLLLLDVPVEGLVQQLLLRLDPEGAALRVAAVPGLPAVPAVPVRLLHGQVEDGRSSIRKVVVGGNQRGNAA